MKIISDYLTITGMTQADLARKTDLDPAVLNHMIAGRREPTIRNLDRISQATGISLENLARSFLENGKKDGRGSTGRRKERSNTP